MEYIILPPCYFYIIRNNIEHFLKAGYFLMNQLSFFLFEYAKCCWKNFELSSQSLYFHRAAHSAQLSPFGIKIIWKISMDYNFSS